MRWPLIEKVMVVIGKLFLPLPPYCSILHYCKIYVNLPPLEASCLKSCQKNISQISSRWQSDSFDHAKKHHGRNTHCHNQRPCSVFKEIMERPELTWVHFHLFYLDCQSICDLCIFVIAACRCKLSECSPGLHTNSWFSCDTIKAWHSLVFPYLSAEGWSCWW